MTTELNRLLREGKNLLNRTARLEALATNQPRVLNYREIKVSIENDDIHIDCPIGTLITTASYVGRGQILHECHETGTPDAKRLDDIISTLACRITSLEDIIEANLVAPSTPS